MVRRLLPAVAVMVFAIAAVAGMRSGSAAALPKPDLVVAELAIGGVRVRPGTPTKIDLTTAAASEQFLGVCVFPWSVVLGPTGLLPGKLLVRNEVVIDVKPMFFDKPQALAGVKVTSGQVSMKPGKHTVHIRLDTEGSISESDEGNNSFDVELELTGKCSNAQPTDDPGTRSKLAKVRATPAQAVTMAAQRHFELVAVPKMKGASKYKRAQDMKPELATDHATAQGPKLWLRMHSIEYYLPDTVPRPANAQMGWSLHTPNWPMRNDESLLMRWKWAPDAHDAPSLSSLDEPDSGVLYINGVAYSTMVNYDSATQSLTSFAHNVPLQSSDWPLEISLAVRTDDQLFVSPKKVIERGSTYDYYDAALAAVFSHDRCKSCHSVGSEGAINAYHTGRAVRPPNLGPQEPDACMSCCHYEVIDRDWRSPRFDQNLDFSQMTPDQICETMTTNLDDQKLWEHFRDDPRVHWAVNSGRVPLGHDDKPVLFPGEYGVDEFLGRVSQWIRHGAPCP